MFRTFNKALGIRTKLIGGFVSICLLSLDHAYKWLESNEHIDASGKEAMIFGIPSWFWAVLFALGYIAYFILSFATKLRREKEEAFVELANLRKIGVEIRNDGRNQFINNDAFLAWKSRVKTWNKTVTSEIQSVSESDSLLFSTIDIVPPPRVPIIGNWYQPEHGHLYAIHDIRLKNLDNLIRGKKQYENG